MNIDTTLQFKTALRSGPYAWPGGYPTYFICDDGGALCCSCARNEARLIIHSVMHRHNDGWRVVGVDINYEDPDLYCDHCNTRIESAYAED